MAGFPELIRVCYDDVYAGRFHAVFDRLSGLKSNKIPNQHRADLAFLCATVDLPLLALRILRPVVLPALQRGRHARRLPTARELTFYARSLFYLGHQREALKIFDLVDAREFPRALFISSLCKIRLWEYRASIRDLTQYLSLIDDDRMIAISKTNLSMCHTYFGEVDIARQYANEAIAYGERVGKPQMQAMGLLELARADVEVGGFGPARKLVDQVDALYGDENPPSRANVTTVRAHLDILEGASPLFLRAHRQKALAVGRWTEIPELTLTTLMVHFNQAKYERLVFGVQHADFRERVRRKLGDKSIGSHYIYGPPDSPCFDVETGAIDGALALNPGKSLHRLIDASLTDFYIPKTLGGFFADLFPVEYFDPDSSPDRVHQLLWRLRQWMVKRDLPVEVTETAGVYKMSFHGSFSFRIPFDRRPIDSVQIQFSKLRTSFQNQSFSAKDARAALGMSPTAFKKFASQALERGLILRSGTNTSTRYKAA